MKEKTERKDRKHEKHSKKKRDKDKKRKKDFKKSRKRASSSRSTSSSESDRDHAVGGSALSQLERERAAVQAARYLLATQPGIRKDFRELLWELDNGRAVGLSGIPDAVLRSQLQFILQHLGLKCTQGQYWLASGASGTLSVIGFVFEEQTPHKPPAPPTGLMTAGAHTAEQHQQPTAAPAAAVTEQQQASHPTVQPSHATGHETPASVDQQQKQQPASLEQMSTAAADLPVQDAGDTQQQQQQQQQPPIGAPYVAADDHLTAAAAAIGPPPQRIVGPAAPSAELLAAAAAYHAEMEAAGSYESAGPDTELLIGPPPPEYYQEADAAAADVREQQVLRVLQVLRTAAASAVGHKSSSSSAVPAGGELSADPYAVLGVDPAADSGTIRKTYWRLSLLVHPDKCSHPAAQEVFQAVSKAAQTLQDTQQRKQLDEQREDAQLRQQALAAAAAAEREIAWRKARGEAVPHDLAAAVAAARSAGAGPAVRESWMTDLPTNQGRTAAQALAMGLSQTSQTSFSRFGVRQPGDTSGWTDTPQQRAMRAAGLLTDSSSAMKGPAALPAAAAAAEEGVPVNAELAAAMREYAQQHRQKSLLEQHAERQAQGTKKQHKEQKQQQESKGQKRKAEGDKSADADWSGKHPWRPWDRDKDLEVQLQRPKAAADMLKAAGNLSSRFSTGR